jgi:hypothetical protein
MSARLPLHAVAHAVSDVHFAQPAYSGEEVLRVQLKAQKVGRRLSRLSCARFHHTC